ncbi:hypothetical protein QZH56_16280 [Streptomyces olivoreticuli]|uniref:hypothetical protein n=1 Tax=Streptomyces olivoreticuli TaxID=68246 RepID=UPI002659E92F|nr:hypothetical protein [Streptomyces olivoreticuli]WKK27006.1 hypothetical protein QZH56_16280 [Streptomyces olivoreticuli]
MEIVVTLVVALAVVAVGVLLIHLLNVQHDQRIAGFHYSGVLPWRDSRSRNRPRSEIDPAGPLFVRARGEQPQRARGRHGLFSDWGRRG